ncbi:nuclear transport factor 2 family protein [Streptomyces yatensis]|uniref:SnoaL-like domain-containing protein n=1 Tax=Streptomyces yatensis TaxID=155177 RepID=A0ABN2IIL5_9ACTN|nr:nuclear transport factor 2 family protein [Streptomyces yatensis]
MSTSTQQRAAFESFLDGMHSADNDAIARNLAENVVLNSPFLSEPITGHEAVANVLKTVSRLADDLTVEEILSGETHHAAFFRLRIEDTEVNGMDYARLDADNKIAELSVLWRPLPSIVEMQGHIAPIIGVPALELRTKGE